MSQTIYDPLRKNCDIYVNLCKISFMIKYFYYEINTDVMI